MMTSTQIRQSFLDFFTSKKHTIVPSSSLMPDSPNLLFTNAGMNQFVPIFLGQQPCPYKPGRAADTQKCIRAGGKHNDLEDVGLDTYHHTFFEMLGNWSFGDYFKKDSIEWGWELLTKVWGFPPARLFATVYNPDKSKGDPSEFDQEAYDIWAGIFEKAGLDPKVHIVNGNKKDNFWMMGDTGPCGPCSEIHVDLTPAGDTRGSLVNKGSAECIEIWNHVFIQFNANADGSFASLPAKHVDTGMGFERVCGIMQCTKGFRDFSRPISNYETDVFRPIFDRLQELSGHRYGSTLPASGSTGSTEQEKIDVAFRVIADHIRTLSFAIADGIPPGNGDRNYVLRRILRRAVRYGRTLGFHQPFFHKLVGVLADTMGDFFPEIRTKRAHVEDVLRIEEESFNRTLDRGIELFESRSSAIGEAKEFLSKNHAITLTLEAQASWRGVSSLLKVDINTVDYLAEVLASIEAPTGSDEHFSCRMTPHGFLGKFLPILGEGFVNRQKKAALLERVRVDEHFAFKLYDTYGFPFDLTQLMAREKGLSVDTEGFETLMEQQRTRARAAQKKEVIEASKIDGSQVTKFVGFESLATDAKVVDVVAVKDRRAVIVDTSPFYAEMGGQVGDTGELSVGGQLWRVTNTQKAGHTWLHLVEAGDAPEVGATVRAAVDAPRRAAIQRHHTVTHVLHWALHEVVSKEATQKGSSVGPDKLTFDFNSAALTASQLADVERLVNERILANDRVSWIEVPYADVKKRSDVMQFFGDKYGDVVRVVQIGGTKGSLDGFSMELCGGTHTTKTGDIGLFRIVAESSVAAGVRRIEAVSGWPAYDRARSEHELLKQVAGRFNVSNEDLLKRVDALMDLAKKLEKDKKEQSRASAHGQVDAIVAARKDVNGIPLVCADVGELDIEALRGLSDSIRQKLPSGLIFLGSRTGDKATFLASASDDLVAKGVHCGKLIGQVAKIAGGGGGGKPNKAEAGGKDVAKIGEALGAVAGFLGS